MKSIFIFLQYFLLVVLIFVTEFILGSMAFTFRDQLQHVLKIELQNGLTHHYNISAKGPNSLVEIWDSIQTQVSKTILIF